MTPIQYNFKEQYSGDTFNGLRITATRTISGNTSPIDLTNVAIKMDIKSLNVDTPLLSLTIGEGITLTDALNGIFTIDRFVVPKVGVHNYDIQFTYQSGDIKTYVKGIFPVENDTTR
jgi:hypothetical protein